MRRRATAGSPLSGRRWAAAPDVGRCPHLEWRPEIILAPAPRRAGPADVLQVLSRIRDDGASFGGLSVGRGRVRVVLAGDVGRFARVVEAAPGADVAAVAEDMSSMIAAARAGLADVVLVGGFTAELSRSLVIDLRTAGAGLIGYAPAGDTHLPALFGHVGLDGCLTSGDGPQAAAAMFREVAAKARIRNAARATGGGSPAGRGTDRGHQGRIVAVWGPAGAPGRSTIAAGLAGAFARRNTQTLLIDADTYGGAQAGALSLVGEARGLVAAARAAERGRWTPQHLAGCTQPVEPRLRVMTGVEGPERWSQVSAPAFEAIVESARETAQVCVLDCGFCLEDDPELSYDTSAPRRNAVTLSALAMADDIVVVGRDDVVGLDRLEVGLLELSQLHLRPTVVVINQMQGVAPGNDVCPGMGHPSRAPRHDLAARRRAEMWARLRAAYRVYECPADPHVVQEAYARGSTVTSVPGLSPLSMSMTALSRALVPVPRSV